MKLLHFLAVLFTALPCAFAQQTAPQPLLWRIEGAKPSYVFGTIHLSGPRESTLAPAVEKAVQDAGALYCEVPMDMGTQMKAMAGMMQGGQSLKETLPADLYARIDAELKHINAAITLAPLDRVPMWALSVMLPMLEEQLKNPGGKPLDAQLYARAEADGKEVGGIETMDEQLKALSDFTPEEQLAMLRSSIEEMEKARKEKRNPAEELRQAYLSGDLAALEKKIDEVPAGLDPKLAERVIEKLLTKRNRLMAERMAKKIKENGGKSYFFAVGAGHLYGEDGVVRLLEKTGLKLERVAK